MRLTIAERALAGADTPVLLMVSGGSDSTALAYLATELAGCGQLGALGMLHVNHRLRGEDADEDARFAAGLAELLGIPLFLREIDVGGMAQREGANVEAVARRERYRAASRALEDLCRRAAEPLSAGRIFTAHTQDDRVESFYMRSIVGTGPGGFRAMRYRNGQVVRPLLDVNRADLRTYLGERAAAGMPVMRDGAGALWREDATNAHTDQFRGYVRHEIVPKAKDRNPQLLATLCRTMNLIADEDDFMEELVDEALRKHVTWLAVGPGASSDGIADPNPENAALAGSEPAGPAPTNPAAAGLGSAGFAPTNTASASPGSAGFASTDPASASPGSARPAPTNPASASLGSAAFASTNPAAAGSEPAGQRDPMSVDPGAGCVLSPALGCEHRALQRRVCFRVLQLMLGPDARVEAASVEAVLAAYGSQPASARPSGGRVDSVRVCGAPIGGYTANIQGNLAVSANKRGVRLEPMAAYRARRKR